MQPPVRFGIDLGGTKTEIVALAAEGGEILRRRTATPRDDYAATLAALARLVGDAERDLRVTGTVGVGTPGSISRATGLLRGSNSVCLNGQSIKRDLEQILDREVRITNDANCFALSEATDGAAAGARIVFGVIVGTGTGAGVVIDRQVLVGANAIGGEWGHNPLPAASGVEWPGPLCYCGRSGCIETFLSGPGLERDHSASGGEHVTGREIAARAAAGDSLADAALARYEDRMARALASIINVIDPDVIVLGGGVSNIERLYERVPSLWLPHIFSDHVVTRLTRAKHGDSSGVRGAAWLWDDQKKPQRPQRARRG